MMDHIPFLGSLRVAAHLHNHAHITTPTVTIICFIILLLFDILHLHILRIMLCLNQTRPIQIELTRLYPTGLLNLCLKG